MATKGRSLIFRWLPSFFLFISTSYSEGDTLRQGDSLIDWEHLVSANGNFTLGFFSIGTSHQRYLGIWYTKYDKKKVWVANRNNPIADSSGNLTVDGDGRLKLTYNGGSINLSNNNQTARNATAILQDDGNFVLREYGSLDGTVQVLWESFGYPIDTLLPGMKLGVDLKTGHQWTLTSWISYQVPATGSFTLGTDFNSTNQMIIWLRGDTYWTSGSWNNENSSFDNLPHSRLSTPYGKYSFSYFSNEDERHFTFLAQDAAFPMFVMQSSGYLSTHLGLYVDCQAYNPPPGCVEWKLPKCRSPTSQSTRYVERYGVQDGYKFENMSIADCEMKCLKNCSCLAYASINAENGTGCEVWSMEMPPRKIPYKKAREIFFPITDKGARKRWWIWVITAIGVPAVLILCFLCYLRWKRLKLLQDTEQLELLFEMGTITKPLTEYCTSDKLENDGKQIDQ